MTFGTRCLRAWLESFIVVFLTVFLTITFCVAFLLAVEIYGGNEPLAVKNRLMLEVAEHALHTSFIKPLAVSLFMAAFAATKLVLQWIGTGRIT